MNAKESASIFDFGERDCLYVDHDGHRVLADIEGAGEFKILRQTIQSTVIVDNILHAELTGSFKESLLITAHKPGLVQIDVRCGPTPQIPSQTIKSDHYQGSGYVLLGQIASLDNDHQPQTRIGYPVPFFQEAKGKNLTIAPAHETLQLVDGFDINDDQALKERSWTVQNISQRTALLTTFADRKFHAAVVVSHLNAASWKIQIPRNKGLILRRLYDSFHGRQRARVLINGEFKGWWYDAYQSRKARWKWSHFGMEAQEGEATITIDPPAGSPLWSVSRMEIWALLD